MTLRLRTLHASIAISWFWLFHLRMLSRITLATYTLWTIKRWQYICNHNFGNSWLILITLHIWKQKLKALCSLQISCLLIYYSAPVGKRSIATSVSVGVFVCPRAYFWNRWTDLQEFFVQIPCGRGSVLLWRRCDKLCNFDVWMMSRLTVYGGAWVAKRPLTYSLLPLAALGYRCGVWCLWMPCFI